MIGSGHVDQGAIYSLAGDSKWAGSKGFEVCLLSAPLLSTRLPTSARASLSRGIIEVDWV